MKTNTAYESISPYRVATIAISLVAEVGGCTLNALTGQRLVRDSGYLVCPLPEHTLVIQTGLRPATRDSIARYIMDTANYLAKAGHYLGLWIDTATGDLHVDISHYVTSRVTANEIATVAGQLAIWDCANNTEIRL